LSHRDDTINAAQLATLVSYLKSIPSDLAILAGDFNAEEDSPQIKQLMGEWTDTYRLIHPLDAGLTCCIEELEDPDANALDLRIDYLFVRHGADFDFQIKSSDLAFSHPYPTQEGYLWASDHFGVWADLELVPGD
jgi:endonuclease/exonuclease/phosphatase family metal-dependent hydrolase